MSLFSLTTADGTDEYERAEARGNDPQFVTPKGGGYANAINAKVTYAKESEDDADQLVVPVRVVAAIALSVARRVGPDDDRSDVGQVLFFQNALSGDACSRLISRAIADGLRFDGVKTEEEMMERAMTFAKNLVEPHDDYILVEASHLASRGAILEARIASSSPPPAASPSSILGDCSPKLLAGPSQYTTSLCRAGAREPSTGAILTIRTAKVGFAPKDAHPPTQGTRHVEHGASRAGTTATPMAGGTSSCRGPGGVRRSRRRRSAPHPWGLGGGVPRRDSLV